MTEIALYDTLRKIPEVSDEEAKQAVADIANSREVATKTDIVELKAATKADIAEVKVDIAELKAETKADVERMGRIMIMWMVGVSVAVVGTIAGIVIAVVG